MNTSAKLAVRIAILTVGLVGSFIASSGKPVPAADGGPILTCGPKDKACMNQLPVADGGPIFTCGPKDKACMNQMPVADGGPIFTCGPKDKACMNQLPVMS